MKIVTLSLDEISEVITKKSPKNYIIALNIYETSMIIIRGDFSVITSIPFHIFKSNNIIPDFNNISIEDYGQVLRFGEYKITSCNLLDKLSNLIWNK